MRQYRNVNELEDAAKSVYQEMKVLMDNIATDIGAEGFGDTLLFLNYLGGDVYVVDCLKDLEEIVLFDRSLSEDFHSCDIAVLLPDLDYAMLVMITSDLGGASYFIPSRIYMQSPNVLMSIIVSNPKETINSLVLPQENKLTK